jgi:hypothetical protein
VPEHRRGQAKDLLWRLPLGGTRLSGLRTEPSRTRLRRAVYRRTASKFQSLM